MALASRSSLLLRGVVGAPRSCSPGCSLRMFASGLKADAEAVQKCLVQCAGLRIQHCLPSDVGADQRISNDRGTCGVLFDLSLL